MIGKLYFESLLFSSTVGIHKKSLNGKATSVVAVINNTPLSLLNAGFFKM